MSDDALLLALRATARISLGLFLAAFVASSVNRLWRTRASKWLLRNRRNLGVAFAVSHFIHFGFIAARALTQTSAFWETRVPSSLIPGATAYLFIVAMFITSFRRPTKWLGRTKWKILHKTGVYVIFAIFVGATAPNLEGNPIAWVSLALLAAALLLRIAAGGHSLSSKPL